MSIKKHSEIELAAEYLEIPTEEIGYHYSGKYPSDVDFAKELCESLGITSEENLIPHPSWLHVNIDWDHTAHELMFYYLEKDGHYFSRYT